MSIPVPLAEFGREAQEQGDAFELVEPAGGYRGDFVGWDRRAGKWAVGTEGRGGLAAEAGEGFVAQEADEVEVFVHEDGDGDAAAAADLEVVGKVQVGVALDVAQIDAGGVGV